MTTDPGPFPGISITAIGQLMPMFLWLDGHGMIRGVGPTLAKILHPAPCIGELGEEHFLLRLPQASRGRGGPGMDLPCGAVIPLGGQRIHLVMKNRPEIVLRGSAVGLGQDGKDGALFNLTFGIHLPDAVREFGLTEGDFAASDLAIELLYMGEANAAVLGELSALTGRLDMARRTAVAQAQSDPLTGLANRRGFDKALADFLEAQAMGGAPFAVFHIDLDYFKAVNDTFGHAAGDQVLMKVGVRLIHELRRGDIVARTGGGRIPADRA
ncbi:GGDEF domain-containing protein [Paenirhodobacter sp.]|uniref:GGDEF domain-containing protein n=1 Tax=Paenirhodobacter sp. TaxID=1965326 RepID=UPI003B405859